MYELLLEKIYHEHHFQKNRYGYLYCHGARVPYIKHWVGTGKKVLDLGCRDGVLTETFAKGNEVIGVDVDRYALKRCQERLNIETQWLDLNDQWPWQEDSFDVIIACEIMEHLFFLDRFLDQVKRTLKKEGSFIGSVPNAFRMKNRLRFLFGKEYETDPTHVRQFSYLSLEEALKKRFSSVQIIPLKGKILPFFKLSEKAPRKLSSLFGKDFLFFAK